MDFKFTFMFRHKARLAHAFIDYTEEPYFIFTVLLDNELIRDFTEEVTIKTDFNKVLPRKDDTVPGLVELRHAIFKGIKETAEFKELRRTIIDKYLNTSES